MLQLTGVPHYYDWGSPAAIPALLGDAPTGKPLAEMWYGAHTTSSSPVTERDGTTTDLAAFITADPVTALGEDVVGRFNGHLPYLLKLIAPAAPLSLQVHPSLERARAQYAAENAAGIPLTSPVRNYKDANHKPELVYALTEFEAMCGFRAPHRAAELLEGLGSPVTDALRATLRTQPNRAGVQAAFTSLFHNGPTPDQVAAVAGACAARVASGDSPSPRADSHVVLLQDTHPGDPGVIAPLLLNPVSLHPGEALFVPAGGVHGYLSGLGVEIMASSDNVLRAGLTTKHVDVEEMLACVDYVAAPPIRIAPEVSDDGVTGVFYVPVDDFELIVVELREAWRRLHVSGPRIVLGLEGQAVLRTAAGELSVRPGHAAFVTAAEGALQVRGHGRVAVAAVP